MGASHVRLENPAHPVKYQGVVCSMKESFGFIERADVVKEIFFHFSEAKTKEELQLGDDVEFTIQTRNVSYFHYVFKVILISFNVSVCSIECSSKIQVVYIFYQVLSCIYRYEFHL